MALSCSVALLLGVTACGDTSPKSEAEHLARAEVFLEKERFNAARIELLNALQANPESPQGRSLLARTYLELGNPDAAYDEWVRAIELGAEPARQAWPMGQALLEAGRWEDIREWPLPDGLSPGDASRLHALKAYAHAAAGNRDLARQSLTESGDAEAGRALRALTQARLALARGEGDTSLHWLETAVEADPELGPAWSALGNHRRLRGDREGAEQAYTRAIATRALPGPDHLYRAMVRLEMGDLEGVREDLDTLEQGESRHPGIDYLEGMLHLQAGRLAQARRSLEESLGRQNDYAPALLALGQVHRRLGNAEQSEYYLKRHLGEVPYSLAGVQTLVLLYAEQGRMQPALALLEEKTRNYPGNPADLYELKGRLLLGSGDASGGAQAFGEALAGDPGSAELRQLLAAALLRDGQIDEGMNTLRVASGENNDPQNQARTEASAALMLLQGGQYEQALEAARRLEEVLPGAALPGNIAGAALMGLGREDEARRAFQQAMELDPDNLSVRMNLAGLELRSGHEERARELLATVHDRNPAHARTAQRLALLDLRAGEPELAQQRLARSIKANPEAVELPLMLARLQMESGAGEKALETLGSAQERFPEDAQVLYALADLNLGLKRREPARRLLREAVAAAQGDAGLKIRLAEAQARAGDERGARDTLEGILDQDPEHLTARMGLVRLLLEQGAVDRALPHVDRLLASRPEDPEVLALIGRAALQQGDSGKAVEYLRRALSGERQERSWVVALAEAHEGAGDVGAAQQARRQWLQGHPGDLAMWHTMASTAMAREGEQAGAEAYRQLLEHHPEDPVALNNAAWLLRASDTDQALEYARRGARLQPEAAPILDTLGVVLLHAGKPGEARETLNRARDLAPEVRPGLEYHLAWAEAESGDQDMARGRLTRLLERFEDFEERDEAEHLLRRL
ncbi:XrtA/PEP-CTERM system TPR-repeat protein PrsT [Ectothiorhodospira mobilis]|uniref:XrtA/PEP-CTERM system TPR-repeat protein PrsT n=1 Tax=Ectothiorhodospira mobilis TaxID=195064 RepID=UPI0019080D39|nr:XrtA/PEP-CTERM system TPR-repeat protein PrsT [Ectothiorhodospira mobilis]